MECLQFFLKVLCKHCVYNFLRGCLLKTLYVILLLVTKIYYSTAITQSKLLLYYFTTLINLLNINDEKAIQVMLYRQLQHC